MIKKYSEWLTESIDWEFIDDEEVKSYQFPISTHQIKAVIQEIEDGFVSFGFLVDGQYDKAINLDAKSTIQLFTTLRKILEDYVAKYQPEEITFIPHDKDPKALEQKEKINSRIEIPGYTKRKIGISTVFSKK